MWYIAPVDLLWGYVKLETCRHTDWTWRQKTKHWPRNEGRKDNHDPVEITMQHCIIETTVQVLPSAHGLSKQINLLSQRKTVPLWSTASLDPWKHLVVIIILQNCPFASRTTAIRIPYCRFQSILLIVIIFCFKCASTFTNWPSVIWRKREILMWTQWNYMWCEIQYSAGLLWSIRHSACLLLCSCEQFYRGMKIN